jgi:hypothetical protein
MMITPERALKASLTSIAADGALSDVEKTELVDKSIVQYLEYIGCEHLGEPFAKHVKDQAEADRLSGEARRLAKEQRRARMEELATKQQVEKTMVEPAGRDEIYAEIQKRAAGIRKSGESLDQAAARFMITPEGDALLRKATRDAEDSPVRKSYHAETAKAADTTGNPVFDEHIYPRIKRMQMEGEPIVDAIKRWQELDPESALLLKASGFAPRQTGGRTAFAINDPRAALAELEALKDEIRAAHPWMTTEQLDREAESRRRALDRANAGNRARSRQGSELPPRWSGGSSPGRV